jgi:hypothetical protein
LLSGGLRSVPPTSVGAAASDLPARIRNGTPSQRHESMRRRSAATVSTDDSGATPCILRVAPILAAHEVFRAQGWIVRNTFTCSSRIDSGSLVAGGSMPSRPTTGRMWFWITWRIAPDSS